MASRGGDPEPFERLARKPFEPLRAGQVAAAQQLGGVAQVGVEAVGHGRRRYRRRLMQRWALEDEEPGAAAARRRCSACEPVGDALDRLRQASAAEAVAALSSRASAFAAGDPSDDRCLLAARIG